MKTTPNQKWRASLFWTVSFIFANIAITNSFAPPTLPFSQKNTNKKWRRQAVTTENTNVSSLPSAAIFESFASLLQEKQSSIISTLEKLDGSGEKFSTDPWGCFTAGRAADDDDTTSSGGLTRVIQRGSIIEKGAVSLTILRKGILSKERAESIRDRNAGGVEVSEGDEYSAAALSLVLHTRSPMIPTFRSDVRLFWVKGQNGGGGAWFGGGADLTPYYMFDEDIRGFHGACKTLCESHERDYGSMKKACDDYFYLPARGEHRGTGGLFFDDLMADEAGAVGFVEGLVDMWMPEWMKIVKKRRDVKYGKKEKDWQLLRRGRYLEFNLLYDRGVKFGLVGRNPRVEGVMVSAPPLIAWEYNHKIEDGSEEARIMEVLKSPRAWV